jgi:hypothetical protein
VGPRATGQIQRHGAAWALDHAVTGVEIDNLDVDQRGGVAD